MGLMKKTWLAGAALTAAFAANPLPARLVRKLVKARIVENATHENGRIDSR